MEFRKNRIFNAVFHLSRKCLFLNWPPPPQILGKKKKKKIGRNARDSRILQFYHSTTTTCTKIPSPFFNFMIFHDFHENSLKLQGEKKYQDLGPLVFGNSA